MNTNSQYGIFLEGKASALTQGNRSTYPESWGSWRD